MKKREDAIEEMTLMLMYMTHFRERSGDLVALRTWKNYPFDIVDRLCDKELIDTKHGNKSAYILPEGKKRAEELLREYGIGDE